MATTSVSPSAGSSSGSSSGTPSGSGVGRQRMKPGRWFSELGWRHLVGVVAVVFAAFPLVYVLSASLSENGTLTGSNTLFSDVSTANYAQLSESLFWTWMLNTLVIAVVTSIGTVLMGAAAAYAFSRFRFSGRRAGLTSLLIIQMFPQMLAFIAIFLLLLSLGDVVPALGLDSKLSLICVYLGGALGVNTFLMYGFFNTVPRELDEAAKLDGATHAQIYWTIILRLVAPILAVVALLSFISTYGEFIIARIVLTSESNWTLAVGLYGWVSSLREANWGLFTAGAVVSALPVLALFLYLQKYIVGGLTAGSVKG
ncbi:sugar ABC transporter permease [Oerskovia merdavium]|uniref:Sugar ABC transporter permease n=1 Tax=Oerskovia merdavium TaxID=2762227 RepID=A0ABR8TV90_9CELL|nr:sugar ABC transporter permease [Oerskovia merdavium]